MPISVLAETPTHWTEHGKGPTAVVVHCSLGSVATWLPLIRVLPGRRIVSFDLPGHGRSGPVDAARGAHTQSCDMLKALCALQPGSRVDLIGHSFGATVALRLAIEAPELVRSLVLIEPVLFAIARSIAPEVFARYHENKADEHAAMARQDRAAAARAFHAKWGGPRAWDELGADTRDYICARIELIEEAKPALEDDAHRLLDHGGAARVLCPTLLVSGTESPPIIEAIIDGLARQIPNADRMVLAGAGHMAPLTHAGSLAPAIGRFLATHGAAAGV